MIQYDKLEEELVRLQRDNTTGKVDHPIDGCFTDNTKIALVDGRTLTIKELLVEQQYKTNYVYTINEITKQIEPKPIKKVFKTKYVNELTKVTLDNDEVIYCTPNHKFMLNDCTYEEIQNIQVGTLLRTNSNNTVKLKELQLINRSCAVYDLEIIDNHNFALACGVLFITQKTYVILLQEVFIMLLHMKKAMPLIWN